MKNIIHSYLEKIDLSKTLVLLTACASFLFCNYALAYIEIPEHNTAIFHTLIGIVDATFVNIVSWYFGSSKSSAKKTELIDKMVDKEQSNLKP
ncbi:MAG TPA: hypothetical protein VK589_21300 [Chryseolinea sp.]|nr:hypothetical protein [Chryseolinea sp.]